MEILKSKKFKLPILYFITDREEIKDLPIGIPFIYGSEKDKNHIIRLLEYEVLFRAAKKTGLTFNFRKILEDNGFKDLKKHAWEHTTFIDVYDNQWDEDYYFNDDTDDTPIKTSDLIGAAPFEDYVKDAVAIVDLDTLKSLNVFPVWLNVVEDAISTNIHNFATFNFNMYNKKLEGMYGGIDLQSPNKNLLNIDISMSIPKAVGTTVMIMSKWMAETFYCDLLITGRDTIFIPYEEIQSMNIDEIYDKYGSSQECKVFRNYITTDVKHYTTCITFGDNHSVCDSWGSEKSISKEKGKELCKWKIEKLICFHTTDYGTIPGFADWFDPKEVVHIRDWVKYID